MTHAVQPKDIRIMCHAIDTCFLVIHVMMFAVFSFCNVTFMANFNIFSISFYLLLPFVVHYEYYRTFAVLMYFEVLAHMSAAIICVGWGCGFELTLISICILLFTSEYFGNTVVNQKLKAVPLTFFAVVAYIGSYVISFYYPAPYTLPESVRFWMQVGWGVGVFGIVVTFMKLFISLACRAEAVLSNEVLHDKLTGLPNRYYTAEYFNQVMEFRSAKQYWLAIADLDDFKAVNDTYGHNCGDYVLKTVAKLLNEHSLGAQVFRWGGEEFLISDCVAEGGSDVTAEVLDHVRRAIEIYEFNYEGQQLNLTITIGATWHKEGQSVSEWIEEADKRLYEGKTSGKNKVVM